MHAKHKAFFCTGPKVIGNIKVSDFTYISDLKNELDLATPPLKLFFLVYTCIPNIKCPSVLVQKL